MLKWFIDAIQSLPYHDDSDEYHSGFGSEYLGEWWWNTNAAMMLKTLQKEPAWIFPTVNRVANNKYVQTEFGTIPLKFSLMKH